MKNGTCPKCGSNDVIPNLKFQSHETDPWVDITEPEPAHRPFVWIPDSARTNFSVYICGDFGYTEFYADNHQELKEKHRKGYK